MILAILSILWATSEALPIESKENYLELDIKRSVPKKNAIDPLLNRRDGGGELVMALDSKSTYYTVTLELGSPAQRMDVLLDTGSSDFWVDGSSSAHGNHFDFNRSTSFRNNESAFSIGYGDGSKVSGFWGTDIVGVFDHRFNASFGVATESTATSPILGLGLEQGEISVSAIDENGYLSPTYPNFPSLLKENGYIHRISYSIWLDESPASDGSILFGGVDHSKYSGKAMDLVPIVNDHSIQIAQHPTTLSVILHEASLSLSENTFSSVMNTPVLLDTGSTMCQLPSNFVDKLGEALNGHYYEELGVYGVDCNSKGIVNFNFSGSIIPVDLENLLIPLKLLGREDSATSGRCGLGILKSDNRKAVLGDGFIRNAYIVFDLEGLQVGIAPATNRTSSSSTGSSVSSSSSIEPIITGIPRATPAPYYSHTSLN